MNLKIVSIVLLGLFVVLASSHLVLAYYRIVKRRPGYSAVPVLNGVLGAAGLLLHPDSRISSWWWAAFVFDWGCLPLAIETVVQRRADRQPARKPDARDI